MTPAAFRKLALSFEGVEVRPHMERTAFRTSRKTFATWGPDRRVNLSIQPAERREALMEAFPETFSSLGGWTRLGFVSVDIASVDDGLFRELLEDAYRDALPVTKAPKKRTATPTKRKS